MQFFEKLSYPQRMFGAIFGESLLELLLIERYEKQAAKITDEFLAKFINEEQALENDKDKTLIENIIDAIYKKGLSKEDFIKQTGLDEETVSYYHAYILRKMRFPTTSKPYRKQIISLLR